MEYLNAIMAKEKIALQNEHLYNMFEMLSNQQSINNIAKESLLMTGLEGDFSFLTYEEEKVKILAFNGKKDIIQDYLLEKRALKFVLETKKPYFRDDSEEKFNNFYAIFPLSIKRETHDEILGFFCIHTEQKIPSWERIITAIQFMTITLNYFFLSFAFRNYSSHDVITSLYNQRHFKEQLGIEINKKLRHQIPLYLLVYDIAHFDDFNKKFDWDAGNQVLRHLGQQIKHSLRNEDMPSRYEADTFMALLSNIEEKDARTPFQRVFEKINNSTVKIHNLNMKFKLKGALIPYDPALTPDEFILKGLEAVGKKV